MSVKRFRFALAAFRMAWRDYPKIRAAADQLASALMRTASGQCDCENCVANRREVPPERRPN